jgi:hypothetical protein
MMYARIGALLYFAWGLLHIDAARKVYALGQSLDPGMVQARIYQNAWTLLFLAIFGIVVAAFLNWRSSRLGYWLNLIVPGVADVGFVIFVLVPGYLPLVPGGLGPLLWILAALFSTIAVIRKQDTRLDA